MRALAVDPELSETHNGLRGQTGDTRPVVSEYTLDLLVCVGNRQRSDSHDRPVIQIAEAAAIAVLRQPTVSKWL